MCDHTDLSNANPARGYKKIRRSTGRIMVTTRYSIQQGSKLRKKTYEVQPSQNTGNLSASRRCLWVQVTVSTVWRAASISESELQAAEKTVWCAAHVTKSSKVTQKAFLAIGGLLEGKVCDTLQEMASTNVKTVHQTSLLHIKSNLDRLGLLSLPQGQ